MLANGLSKIGAVITVPATIMSVGASWLVSLILRQGFDRTNDSWAKRGLLMSAFGLVLMVILGSPVGWPFAFMDLMYSFGDQATMEPKEALLQLFLLGVGPAFFLHGLVNIIDCYWFEYSGERYLYATRPTFRSKVRSRKASKALREASSDGNGWMRFGIIVDDVIPWRTPRHGMVCERPLSKLGHGVILGGNGTGKTILALSLAHQGAASDAAVLYIDYKASLETYKAVRGAARAAGKDFYSFDLGINSGEATWYDPLAWHGTPSEKSSMLVSSFNFSETGDSSFYKNVAEQWLTLQFEIMQEVGIYKGESQFDFLLETATPAGLAARLDAIKSGSDNEREMYKQWRAIMATIKVEHLASLRANLSNVVNAGGGRLRPHDDDPAISLARIAENGGVCYIGLSPSTNDVALKIIGSLVLRDLGVLAADRTKNPHIKTRRVLALVDEASRMGPRAVVMDNLFAMAREGDIDLWVITQSFSSWPATTKTEMATNVSSRVVFRVQDPATAEDISKALGVIPAMTEMSEEKITHHALRGETSDMDGDARWTLGDTVMISPDRLGSPNSLPNEHAYVWFSGSHPRPTRKKWRSRRVRHDEIGHDAPLVKVVVANSVVNPPEEQIVGRTFDDLVRSDSAGSNSTRSVGLPSQLGESLNSSNGSAPNPEAEGRDDLDSIPDKDRFEVKDDPFAKVTEMSDQGKSLSTPDPKGRSKAHTTTDETTFDRSREADWSEPDDPDAPPPPLDTGRADSGTGSNVWQDDSGEWDDAGESEQPSAPPVTRSNRSARPLDPKRDDAPSKSKSVKRDRWE